MIPKVQKILDNYRCPICKERINLSHYHTVANTYKMDNVKKWSCVCRLESDKGHGSIIEIDYKHGKFNEMWLSCKLPKHNEDNRYLWSTTINSRKTSFLAGVGKPVVITAGNVQFLGHTTQYTYFISTNKVLDFIYLDLEKQIEILEKYETFS